MMSPLYNMLLTSAHADKAKAELTFELLSKYPAGIGDHSTSDFYKNAEEALRMLIDAEERIEMLNKTFLPSKSVI